MSPEEHADALDPNTIRVLLTGFGPFFRYKENPSWLAAKALHNTVIYMPPPDAEPVVPPKTDDHAEDQTNQPDDQPSRTGPHAPYTNVQPVRIEPQAMQIESASDTYDQPIDIDPVPTDDDPIAVDDDPIDTDVMMPAEDETLGSPQPIHITSFEVPVTYQAVLDTIPPLYQRPPILPIDDPTLPPPPPHGYDFIFHLGVAGRGPLRIEKIGHKLGYRMKDSQGQHAPIVHIPKEGAVPELSDAERVEMERILTSNASSISEIGNSPMSKHQHHVQHPGHGPPPPASSYGRPPASTSHGPISSPVPGPSSNAFPPGTQQPFPGAVPSPFPSHVPSPVPGAPGHITGPGPSEAPAELPSTRGFGPNYETFPDELTTDIDVARLINHLKETGVEQVYSSMDAGHHVSDFMFYCSLAESRRVAMQLAEKEKAPVQPQNMRSNTPPKGVPVLFMHCGPVDQPMSTMEVVEAIKKIIFWVCRNCL